MSISALRALEVMDAVREGPLTITEIARRTGQDKAAVSRTASSLAAEGWLVRTEAGIGLGTRAILLGAGAEHRQALERARSLAHAVSGMTGLTVVVSTVARDRHIVITVAPGPQGLPDFFAAGVGAPMWATAAGVVLLAQLTDEEAVHIVDSAPMESPHRRTPDRDGVLAEVALARTRGVAVDRGWSHDGARCIATPYPWFEGAPAVMSALGYAGMREDRLAFTEAQLRIACEPGATRSTLVEAAGRHGTAGGTSSTLVDVVQAALRNFHKPQELAVSPLAPVDGTVAERATAVQRRLREAVDIAFIDSRADDDLRRVLAAGYLAAGASHATAIRQLHLGRATYYRRLAEGVTRVADTLAVAAGHD